MKRITTLCCAALALLATGIQAQTVMDGRVKVLNLDAARNEGRLFVTMDLDVTGLDVATNREVYFTPVLRTATDSVALPSVLIAGRNRYYHHLRNGIADERTALYREGEATVIPYSTSVPYEQWMQAAGLDADSRTCGCCGEPVASTGDRLMTLDFVPRVFRPAFVYISPEGEARKIREVRGSAYIDFPVNRTEIHEEYRRNPDELEKIRHTIGLIRDDRDIRITSITIKGYASPEGPYRGNERLAEGRTRALISYVRRLYDFPASIMESDWEAEDWTNLRAWVASSGLEHRDEILAIIDSSLEPDPKEWRIKKNYPEEYAFLLREVYPSLRHSDYTVEYEVTTYTDPEQIKALLRTQPQKLSLQEMFLAAQTLEPGSDEYNEVFEIAVRMFPDDPVANLNAANTALARGDLKSAERYLAKAGDSPEAIYARGIYAALGKEYDTARNLFEEARSRGIAEASEALGQIDELEEQQD